MKKLKNILSVIITIIMVMSLFTAFQNEIFGFEVKFPVENVKIQTSDYGNAIYIGEEFQFATIISPQNADNQKIIR